MSEGGKPTLIGWIVFLMLMFLANRTKTGHVLIFWSLVIIAVYLFIANYKKVIPVLVRE